MSWFIVQRRSLKYMTTIKGWLVHELLKDPLKLNELQEELCKPMLLEKQPQEKGQEFYGGTMHYRAARTLQ